MSGFELSKRAITDIAEIRDYTLSQWGAAQAKTYLDQLEAFLQQLASSPGVGRKRPDLSPNIQSMAFQSHIIYYRATQTGIELARLLHQRQDPDQKVQ